MEKKKINIIFSRQSIIAAAAAVGPKLPPKYARVRRPCGDWWWWWCSFTGHGTERVGYAAATDDDGVRKSGGRYIYYIVPGREKEEKKKNRSRESRAMVSRERSSVRTFARAVRGSSFSLSPRANMTSVYICGNRLRTDIPGEQQHRSHSRYLYAV